MTFMDGVQILIALLLILLILKPVWAHFLPRQWRGITRRLLPARALKYEGTWKRDAPQSDTTKQ